MAQNTWTSTADMPVISIGHAHPRYVKAASHQVAELGFYSNSVINGLQQALAEKLGRICGMEDYSFFMCNSGAEANENAIKLASFATGRDRVIAFSKSFHGRTSAAVAVTDNPKIVAPANNVQKRTFVPMNDIEAVRAELAKGDVCRRNHRRNTRRRRHGYAHARIHGVTGGRMQKNRDQTHTDEIQSGTGRTGKYFAFQHYGIRPDIVSVAKGLANGFPIGGILIAPDIEARYGMLGTTFGGNHLACAAALATLEVIEQERLIENAAFVGAYAAEKLAGLPHVTAVKGRGLMLGESSTVRLPTSAKN